MKQMIKLAALLFVGFMVVKNIAFPLMYGQQVFSNLGYNLKTSVLNALVLSFVYHCDVFLPLVKKLVLSPVQMNGKELRLSRS